MNGEGTTGGAETAAPMTGGEETAVSKPGGTTAGADRIRIHVMTEADVDRISELERENFSEPWSRNAFLEVLKIPEILHLVAEKDGTVIGGAAVRNISGEGEITNVVVDPAFRCRGVARRLLAELLKRGGEAGIEAFTLEVRVGNRAAVHLYESLGFVSAGLRPGFYAKPREDAMIFWKR